MTDPHRTHGGEGEGFEPSDGVSPAYAFSVRCHQPDSANPPRMGVAKRIERSNT